MQEAICNRAAKFTALIPWDRKLKSAAVVLKGIAPRVGELPVISQAQADSGLPAPEPPRHASSNLATHLRSLTPDRIDDSTIPA